MGRQPKRIRPSEANGKKGNNLPEVSLLPSNLKKAHWTCSALVARCFTAPSSYPFVGSTIGPPLTFNKRYVLVHNGFLVWVSLIKNGSF